jgi:phage terminase large subunit GpA-like protein
MKWMAVMKGAQIGMSAGVLIPVQLWMIKNDPSNTYFLVGSPLLVEKATEKLDIGINNAGLRDYIKPQAQRKRANKSGDTNNKKEFSGGYIHIGSANNHKEIRDVSLKYGLFDDFESVKSQSKESGSTMDLLEQRFAAYADCHKIAYVSTPELDSSSNIRAAYLLGDQRKYMVQAPCCGEYIELKWSDEGKGGITWKLNDEGQVISESVGYICQKCGGFFNDKDKDTLLNSGYWEPTAKPSKPGYYSYHISALYAPLGMYDWEHYVNIWVKNNPPGQPRNEAAHKTFVNVVLGETYVEVGEEPKANQLQLNQRNYELGLVPERVSISDGNGKIVLITCACDLNGKLDDARLDYEVVAWSENGSTYSITHGSIGTFIPNQNTKQKESDNRERWTYEHNRPNSVWREFDLLLNTIWQTDTGRKMKIFISGVDTGYCEKEAFEYIDKANTWCVGLKGDKEDKYKPLESNLPCFKIGRSRANLYILRVGQLKDELATLMRLKWTAGSDESQPSGFCNYPVSKDGKYQYKNYFSHFESEQRTVEGNSGYAVWKKKSPTAQNHLWDCRIYNMALRNIMMDVIFKEYKIKNGTWQDYVDMVAGGK